MNRLIFATAFVAISSACASGSLQPGAEQVMRTDAAHLSGCEHLGTISARLLRTRQDYKAHRAQGYPAQVLLHAGHKKDLFDDARNQAAAMGGNRVIPEGAFQDGAQRWAVYRCGGDARRRTESPHRDALARTTSSSP